MVMVFMVGAFLGALSRVIISFLGGNRVEGLITAVLIMSGLGGEFSLGFLSTFIGFRGLSLPMDVLQPVNVYTNPFLVSYKNRQVMMGEGPALIRGMYMVEIMLSWVIWLPGILCCTYFWQGGMKNEFSQLVLAISPYLICLIWIGQLIRSKRKGRFLISMLVVGSFGLLITNSGVGQFGVLISLSLLFMGWEGLGRVKRIPEQDWSYEGKDIAINEWGIYSLICGALSALCIGCPSGPLIELYEDEHMSSGERFWPQLVSSKVSEAVSLLLWFYFGASRGATSDVLDKTVEGGLLSNPSMVLGFMVILLLCNYTCWVYLDLFGKLSWVWFTFLMPFGVLNIGITLTTLIFYIPLGVPIHLLPLLVVGALLVREVIDRLKVESTAVLSMVSIIPLVGIYL
jgi:hypothetical protein